jgi:hypothetical protein
VLWIFYEFTVRRFGIIWGSVRKFIVRRLLHINWNAYSVIN